MRIGMGYDVHRLAEDRKLIIGGVEIPYEKGLLGHSDADVLLHAIMDALLGAAALGDIGKHLYENLISYNNSEGAGWTSGESWSLGDSPAIAIAINPGCGHYKTIKAPIVADDTSSVEDPIGRLIRQYIDVDSRYILEDLIAKLELFVQTD